MKGKGRCMITLILKPGTPHLLSLLPDTALEPHQYNEALDTGAGDLVHRPAQAINSPYLFLHGSVVKNLPAMQQTWVRSLGREDPLDK